MIHRLLWLGALLALPPYFALVTAGVVVRDLWRAR